MLIAQKCVRLCKLQLFYHETDNMRDVPSLFSPIRTMAVAVVIYIMQTVVYHNSLVKSKVRME